ncbi:AT-rich interactive domain-containing protein 2-like protein [Dinothrombium tinctorium]|uniref:folate gamma-glutamyl hydrolase n=1 Tax=Dinothrombium tinctorium TaxID=1965070 RepID=A0A443RKI8_9ACAR|nr:AT-rich interactive domain-containing protein 2-like protein [Dinothrombium tinctorium]
MTAKSQQFLNELALFYRNKGQLGVNSQHFVARLNGQPVNLWDLYSCVLEMGGSCKVNLASQWDEVYAKVFKTPPVGTNVSVALRQIYQRYLMPYEKVNYSNFSSDLLDDEEEESISAVKDSGSNFVIHSSFTSVQQPQQSSANSCVNPMNKLFCSLLCGLPNEIELGLSVATLLANSKDVEDIADFKFIDVLLECLTSYACVCDDETYESDCNRKNDSDSMKKCLCLERFWYKMCKDKTVFELVFGSLDLNAGHHSPQNQQKIFNRVKRIADLIKNLSYSIDESNQKNEDELSNGPNYFNCASLRLLKILLLLLTSDDQNLSNIGLDIISNVVVFTTFVNDEEQYLLIQQSLYRHCIATFMNSNDIYAISRCLEVITKLISTNGEISHSFMSLLNEEVSQRLTELLTCQHDVSLVVASLECCLALSHHNPKLLLSRNKYLIKILLNLLNCEASQHFTSKALKKIKIIDERPQKSLTDSSTSTNSLSVSVLPNRTTSGQSSSNVDNETFALNWLRSSYEIKLAPSKNQQSLRISDMYADYVKYCCRSGRRNVIGAPLFTQIIKRCFPSSIISQNSYVEGIASKPPSLAPKPQSQLASPILKAHLTNKLRSNTVTTSTSTTCTKPNNATTSINSNVAVSGAVKTSVITCNPSTNLKPSPVAVASNNTMNEIDAKTNLLTAVSSSVVPPLTTSNSVSVLVTNGNGQITSATSSSLTVTSSTNPCLTSIPTAPQSVTGNPVLIGAPQVAASTSGPQQAQQFLLVRTIFTSPQQQGTPVRLILPATVFNQQRPVLSNITVNGIAGNTQTTQTTVSVPTTSSAAVTSTNDILLKAVLGSGIVSEAPSTPPSPVRTNAVKSSPLLNVLLDKGKLPDFSTMAATVSQSTVSTNTATTSSLSTSMATVATVSSVVTQQPKMFILTTKSPLAIKSIPNMQQAPLQNQQIQQLQHPMVMQQSQPVQQSSSSLQLSSVHDKSKNSLVNSTEIISNGEVSMDGLISQPNKLSSNAVTNDLSPIKDIRKTVDDATKFISKRPNEDTSTVVAQKKSKLNATINSVSNTAVKSSVAVKGMKNYSGNHVKAVTSVESAKTVTSVAVSTDDNNKSEEETVTLSATTCLITTSTTTVTTTKTTATPNVSKQLEFVCEWHGCKLTFTNASKVYIHVHDAHVNDKASGPMSCQWGGPEGIGPGCQSSRPKLSLLTHLQDFHCNPTALHQAALRNQQIASTGSTSVSAPQPPPAHPGYAHNAALLAIKRHAINYVEPPSVPKVTPTTPLTASIRLTAALTLRNLCFHSVSVRKTLQSYEPFLNELCIMEGRDESRTIAQCLARYWGHFKHYRHGYSYLAASYVKWLESAGARVVPIHISQSFEYYQQLLEQINGVLLPGGNQYFGDSEYSDAAVKLWNLTIEMNQKNDYFPLFGTCLGFEGLFFLQANQTNPLTNCSANDIALPINFTFKDPNETRLFRYASPRLLNVLKTKNVTANYHHNCMTRANFTKFGLDNFYQILSLSKDRNGFEFISSIEAKSFPIYGVQFHPEKNIFEFLIHEHLENIPHSAEAVEVGQYFANFFVNETRKNCHRFKNKLVETSSLIYNFNPEYTGIHGRDTFEQIYFFKTSSAESLEKPHFIALFLFAKSVFVYLFVI